MSLTLFLLLPLSLRLSLYLSVPMSLSLSLSEQSSVRQLQQELADSLKKLSMSEASLEVNTRYRNDLEEEKARLFKDLDRLKGKVGNGTTCWTSTLTAALY